MAMTDKEQKDLRSYCAFMLKEYGFDFPPSDPVVPALYVIHKEMQFNNESNQAIASQVKEAASKINNTAFHFNSADAAFKFQLGIAVKWMLIGILLLLFLVVSIWYWSLVNNVDEAKAIIQSAGNMGELIKRVKKDNEGYLFIDFIEAKGDSIQRFKEFEKLDAKTVRIYVGQESK
jgi:hypothetical protein